MLDNSPRYLKGVGPQKGVAFENIGVNTGPDDAGALDRLANLFMLLEDEHLISLARQPIGNIIARSTGTDN